MADLLKHAYNDVFIKKLAGLLSEQAENFNKKTFTARVFDQDWNNRELKSRMDHITRCVHDSLATDYVTALSYLKPIAECFSGFEAMLFPHYVELYGQKDLRHSISALEHFTCFSSSEFAVRPFIINSPDKMMKQMLRWSKHKNYHVRRLASEGCRPRLPWAMALPAFKKNPGLIFPVLEQLKTDDSEYVRKSVANNLNDIAKDHPDTVKQLAADWLGHDSKTDWIVKHGCRTLLKQGDKNTLALFGYHPADHIAVSAFKITSEQLSIGDTLEFSFKLSSKTQPLGKIRVEYVIDYVKSTGRHTQKVFKISESDVDDKNKSFKRKQSLRNMSTRKHYPGKHYLSIVINGVMQKKIAFGLGS